MLHRVTQVASDFSGLWRVCGPRVACEWLLHVAGQAGAIIRERTLQPADHAMGGQPLKINYPTCPSTFLVPGGANISGVREMYVRDCYLRDEALSLRDAKTVVDLGSNMGNFTNLALAHNPEVRVVAVEPGQHMIEAFKASTAMNPNHLERTDLIRAFLGAPNQKTVAIIADDPNYATAPWLTEHEFVACTKLSEIDFLKCDIEGGEFEFLSETGPLLTMTRQLAVEIHSFAGDVSAFVARLERHGFEVRRRMDSPDGTCILLAARAANAQA
jgi:FkbM family methyltransferase